jgi:hypothetical protein
LIVAETKDDNRESIEIVDDGWEFVDTVTNDWQSVATLGDVSFVKSKNHSFVWIIFYILQKKSTSV